jgi:hypothetical protein
MFQVKQLPSGNWDCGEWIEGLVDKQCQHFYGRAYYSNHKTKQEALRCRLVRIMDAYTCNRNKKSHKYQEIERLFADPEFERSPIAVEYNALLREYWER